MSKMHIWLMSLPDEEGIESGLIQKARSLLSEDELERTDRFIFKKDRNRFVMAHALCRAMLSEYSDTHPTKWRFLKEETGRPYPDPEINNKRIDFNLSHTKGLVGCALAFGRRVGLDLEPKLREVELDALAEKQFSAMEYEQLRSLTATEKQQLFFQIWTLKEAYIKVTGKGLTESLSSFGFELGHGQPKCVIQGKPQSSFDFGLFEASADHQGAWAQEKANGQTAGVEIKELDIQGFEERLG